MLGLGAMIHHLGGRNVTDPKYLNEAVAVFIDLYGCIDMVVSGGAPGADALGEAWAVAHGLPVKVFPANWNEYGKAAGPLRNAEMVAFADALLALHDGVSPGTQDCIDKARAAKLMVYVHAVPKENK